MKIIITALLVALASASLAEDEAAITVDQEAITCETVDACKEQSVSLEEQLGVLEAKGIENLTDDEFLQYAALTDELLVIQNQMQEMQQEMINAEAAKQDEQAKKLAAAKAETADIEKTNGKLAELEGVLSEE